MTRILHKSPSPLLNLRGGEASTSQLQLDAAFDSFSSQASDLSSLTSMTLAGFAGKFARVGILSVLGRASALGGPLQNFISHLGSVAAEAAIITGVGARFSRPGLDNPAPTQEFFKNFVNFGVFRLFHVGATCFARELPLQHLIQSLAMMAGHQAATFAGFETGAVNGSPTKSLTEQFLEANLATLQIAVGGRLAAEITGGRLQIIEGNLEEEARLTSSLSHFPFSSSHFPLPSFSMAEPGILEARLQEAYRSASDYDATTLQNIENCLRYVQEINAARSSSGTFKDALVQRVIEGIAQFEGTTTRNEAFQTLFANMELGLSQAHLLELVIQYNPTEFDTQEAPPCSDKFLREHGDFIPQEGPFSWADFTPQERNLLLSFTEHLAGYDSPRARKLLTMYGKGLSSGRYSPEAIHRTLSHAQQSPIGEYILRRFTCILASEDIAGKLEELREEHSIDIDELIPTPSLITKMSLRGISAENIAQAINGTIHTAYLDDVRVAERVVLFYRRIYGLGNPSERRADIMGKWKKTFTEQIFPRWRKTPKFTFEDLLDVINTAPNKHTRQLVADCQAGCFEVAILDDASFNEQMRLRNTTAQGNQIAFYIQRHPPEKPLILIRGFEIKNLEDPASVSQLTGNILFTIPALLHEWEHFRHFNGSNVFPATPHRADRMASEVLAYLEEYAWTVEYLNDRILASANLLGMSPVTLARCLTDLTYYKDLNTRLAREVMP